MNHLTLDDKYHVCYKSSKEEIVEPVDGQCPFFEGEPYSVPIYKFVTTTSTIKQIGEVGCRKRLDMNDLEGFVVRTNKDALIDTISVDPRVEDYEFWDDNDD
jgi:hypothetical protein